MKVTVSEALRIRKSIASVISSSIDSLVPKRRLYGTTDTESVSYGTVKHNGELMLSEGVMTIEEKMSSLEKILGFSWDLNKLISDFNHENGIGNMVRKKENLNQLFKIYDTTISKQSKQKKITKKESTDSGSVLVTVEFDPYISHTKVKEQLKTLRRETMEIQSKIDKLNAKSIELPFELDEYEEILNILK